MGKVINGVFLIVLVAVFGFVSSASAHVWRTDGNITVLLHVNPIDAPVAGQPAELLFGITDAANQFATGTCQCSVEVSENGKVLLNKELIPWTGGPSLFTYEMPFTFPNPAVYSIVVTGSPKASGTFQNFQVSYDERVGRNPNDPSADSDPLFYLAMGGVAVLILGSLYLTYRQVKREWNENSSSEA
ncbi:MAG TPA: hypothetical protein VMU07_03190 [Candidatus Paceibacterota bacterium]|nr:hypothetical protein [Candidatus Paceibacterota bacterium]